MATKKQFKPLLVHYNKASHEIAQQQAEDKLMLLDEASVWIHNQLDLNDAQSNDLRRRSTTKGPHKADIIFESKGSLIKDKFSRGEQKLLSIIWSMSQNIMLGRVYNLSPILLLDDLSSELDSEMLECFLPALKYIENRFIFSNIVDLFGSKIDDINQKLKKFHVEQITQ